MKKVVAQDPLDYEIRGMYRFATLKEDATLVDEVRDEWPENPRLLMVAADPDDDTLTENLALDLASALVKAGLAVGEVRVLETETASVAPQLIPGADIIVLADGADEKRDAFYEEVSLPNLLETAKDESILIALSPQALEAAGA